jgi:hypothetical protein
LKGSPVPPGGSLTSKPTWSKLAGFGRVGFFLLTRARRARGNVRNGRDNAGISEGEGRGRCGRCQFGVSAAPRGTVFDADLTAELTRRVVLEAASEGSCVILGRGAQCVLRDRDDVLQVFVYAPLPDRVRRLAARHGGEPGATVEMERVDRARAAYVQHYYASDRTARELYDLLVNSRLGLDAAARMILCASGYRPESA